MIFPEWQNRDSIAKIFQKQPSSEFTNDAIGVWFAVLFLRNYDGESLEC